MKLIVLREVCLCGKEIVPHELCIDTEVCDVRALCAECLDEARKGFERARADFAELIAHGVHSKMANRIMVARIARDVY